MKTSFCQMPNLYWCIDKFTIICDNVFNIIIVSINSKMIQKYHLSYVNKLAAIFEAKKISGKILDVKRGARSISYALSLTDPMQLKDTMAIGENLALACRSPHVLGYRDKGQIIYQIELPEHLWLRFYRQQDVTGLAIGLTDKRKPVEYSFDPPHSLICGATGSGKTFTAISILLALCETYAPNDLEVIICDSHNEFNQFENEEHIVKFDYGCIAVSYEDIKSSIAWLHNQMMQRIRANNKGDRKLLIIVDEAESVCDYDKETLKILVDVANQGRKYNVHLMITAKKPTQATLPRLINTVGNRFVGRTNLDPSSVSRLLGQSINIQALTNQGDFIHFDNNGIERFLVATIREQDYDTLNRIDKTPIIINNTIEEVTLDGPGRPPAPIEMKPLAYYWHRGPDNISPNEADDLFGFSRYYHFKYCDYIKEFARFYLRYRK